MTRRELVIGGMAAGAAIALGVRPRSVLGAGTTRRLYCAINGSMTVYDVPSWTVLKTVPLATADGPRGIVCDPGRGSLWITHGSSDGSGGSLMRYDLATDSVLWDKPLGFGVDQPALSVDGSKLYVPTGEKSTNNLWYILDPVSGGTLGTVGGGVGPHNTLARSQHVYLGAVGSKDVFLDNGFKIGPFVNGIRPFTVDAAEQLLYATATHVRGYQVASVTSGKVLATVKFGTTPTHYTPSAPSHGISLSPSGAEVWVLDMPAQRVRIYKAGSAPKHLADVAISPIKGTDKPATAYDNIKAGWVLHSKWGDYVYVADSGSVISTSSRKPVVVLPALANGRHGVIEVMFDANGKPVDTSTHFGMSY